MNRHFCLKYDVYTFKSNNCNPACLFVVVSKENFSDADCLCIIVLTHGHIGDRIFAKDYPYRFEDLWTPFTANRCPTLAGKPKLFFIQVCVTILFIQCTMSIFFKFKFLQHVCTFLGLQRRNGGLSRHASFQCFHLRNGLDRRLACWVLLQNSLSCRLSLCLQHCPRYGWGRAPEQSLSET